MGLWSLTGRRLLKWCVQVGSLGFSRMGLTWMHPYMQGKQAQQGAPHASNTKSAQTEHKERTSAAKQKQSHNREGHRQAKAEAIEGCTIGSPAGISGKQERRTTSHRRQRRPCQQAGKRHPCNS